MASRPWSCALCTYENTGDAMSCSMCRHRRAPGGASATKKARTTPTKAPSKLQSLLVGSVGSSKEQEAKRLEKKVQQMRELGIDLSEDEIVELLARNCYCVPVAASAYFERLAFDESHQVADGQSSAASNAAARDDRIAESVKYFETSFLGKPYKLLGSKIVIATITRANSRLAVGDRLHFQGENVGKKRVRPGTTKSSQLNGSIALASSPGASSSTISSGIVRVSTTDLIQLGRLEREMECMLHPLLKEGLVSLGGVCVEAPYSNAIFASFNVLLFVYVHPRAFEIFQEDHALFTLSDPLYYILDTMHSGARRANPLSSSVAPSSSRSGDNDTSETPRDLETLFSAFSGPASGDSEIDFEQPADELAPLFKDNFELRSHQKQALAWMLWREKQSTQSPGTNTSAEVNPLWEERQFYSNEVFYINPFEKIASLETPPHPVPCLGGILADDMGMGKTIMLLSLVAHRNLYGSKRDMLSPQAAQTVKTVREGATLIVCPLSLLHQWKNEIEDRFQSRTFSLFVYYGEDRGAVKTAISCDIVLTTYGVLCSEFDRSESTSALFSTRWERVILDEAHSIKTRTTNYFRACHALKATHRWCLTGTPLQNSLSDLFSLLCFLQYEPWCRVAWWQRVIARPFEQGDEDALARLKVILKPILLRRTKLSRDAHGNNIVDLPKKTIEVVRLKFTEEERTFYQAVYDRSRAEFNGFVASGTTMSSYIAIFALLLRLRQACDHPFLALGRNSELAESSKRKGVRDDGNTSGSEALRLERQPGETMESYFHRISSRLHQDAVEIQAAAIEDDGTSAPPPSSQYIKNVLTQIQEEGVDSQECPVCLDPPRHGVLTQCAHLLCEDCLRDSITNDPENGCPVCRSPVEMSKVIAISTTDAAVPVDTEVEEKHSSEQDTAILFLSSKLRRLIQDLQSIRDEDLCISADSGALSVRRKVVVFSQWTHMLEMVADVLAQHKFRSCLFHGAMSQETREKVLRSFHNDPEVDVLVISLKAGGVGLNLTCASVVVLLDPWWNPGVEDQAIDRVHRLGQTREVVVKRYIVENTVEEMILQLQERKEKLAKNVLVAAKAADDRASDRLGMEDLLAFFK